MKFILVRIICILGCLLVNSAFAEDFVVDTDRLIALEPEDVLATEWHLELRNKAISTQALAECRSHICSGKKCNQVKISENTIQPYIGGFFRRIQGFEDLGNGVFMPIPGELVGLTDHLPPGEEKRNAAYFHRLVCTYQPSQLEKVYDTVKTGASFVVSEANDWLQVGKHLGVGAASTLKNAYSEVKVTAQKCPKEFSQLVICRTLSMVVPGNAGSYWFGDQAKILQAEVTARKAGIENPRMLFQKLWDKYMATRNDYNSNNQMNLESLLGQIQTRVDTQFDHAGELPQLIKQLDAALSLPTKTRVISAYHEGDRLKRMLSDSKYPEDIQDQVYETVALSSVAIKRGIYIPTQPSALKGPPGVGKTRLVKEVTRSIGGRLCEIQFNSAVANIEVYLLGGRDYSSGSGKPILGKLVECMSEDLSQSSPNGKNDQPIVIFFDELEKLLNQDNSGGIRQFFLSFFNPSPEGRILKVPGLNGLEIDFRNAIVFVAINDNIFPLSDLTKNGLSKDSPQKFDTAFEDRLKILEMKGYSREDKIEVGHGMLKKAMDLFQLNHLSNEARENHEKIVHLDKRDGLRVMEAAIFINVAREAARQDGWELKPMNIENALKLNDKPAETTKPVLPVEVDTWAYP